MELKPVSPRVPLILLGKHFLNFELRFMGTCKDNMKRPHVPFTQFALL